MCLRALIFNKENYLGVRKDDKKTVPPFSRDIDKVLP